MEQAKYGDYGRQKCRDWSAWDDDRYQEGMADDEYEYCGSLPKIDQEVTSTVYTRTVLNSGSKKESGRDVGVAERTVTVDEPELEIYELEMRARAIKALMKKGD